MTTVELRSWLLMLSRLTSPCLIAFMLVGISCTSRKPEEKITKPVLIDYSVQRSLPHDTKAFTQGLVIHNGKLYESTGQEGSWIGVVDIQTGKADKIVILDKKYFGEGIVILNRKVYQLTWQSKVGFVYSLEPFSKIGEFTYSGEGWGLTTDGKNLIMSNGSEKLSFLDTTSMKIVRSISVTYESKPVTGLNELEYADGFVYANIWQSDLIARIDAGSGKVIGFLDLSPLTQQAKAINPQSEVLNGIAWHPATRTMLVTGKNWPFIFILKLKN